MIKHYLLKNNNGLYHHIDILQNSDHNGVTTIKKGNLSILVDGAKLKRYQLHGKQIEKKL